MKTDLSPKNPYATSLKAPHQGGVDPKARKDSGPAPAPKEEKLSPDFKVELSARPSLPSAPDVKLPGPVKAEIKKEAVKAIEKPEPRPGTVKKDAIIFIKGLDVFSSPSKSEGGYAGVGRLAESVQGSRIYGWDQKDEIIREVQKVHPDYKVILVGHSLGGDTAVEVANELDSLENKFRPVDLLITMDAVGFNNDIVPQNVRQHLNVFGENDFFFNDGPHVARNHERTEVKNILSHQDHTAIDDDKEIQYQVVNLIQKTLRPTYET